MKKLSKLMSMLLALALCLTMAPAAFAADTSPAAPTTGDGSITITNATIGATYTAYKLFEATVNGDAESPNNISYTATQEQYDFWNGHFRGMFTFEETPVEGVYNVVDADIEKLANFFNGVVDSLPEFPNGIQSLIDQKILSQPKDPQVADSDTVLFDDLPYGYYFVTSTVGAAVTITSTDPDATVIDKNQEPKFDKTMSPVEGNEAVTDNPANDGDYGDEITYTITADTTNYYNAEPVKSYYFLDTLDSGLSFTDGVVTIEIQEFKGNDAEGNPVYEKLDKDAAAEVLWWKGNDKADSYETADSFSVFIKWVDDAGEFRFPANTRIVITYKATINEGAKIGIDGNYNTANFRYSPETTPPDGPEPSKEWGHDGGTEQTVTYTYALALLKVNESEENRKKLAGAEFTITDPDGKTIYAEDKGNGVYEYKGVLEEGGKVPEGYTSTFKTDDKGQIVLKGVDQGTYTAIETKAPAGYNLLTEPVELEANTLIGETKTQSYYYKYWYVEKDADGNVIQSGSDEQKGSSTTQTEFEFDVTVAGYAVVNNQGNLLPSTGGIGTTIFYVVGGVLVVAALVLFLTKKRMNNKD